VNPALDRAAKGFIILMGILALYLTVTL